VLIWVYACQSKVVSIVNSPTLVTRAGLELEVDHFLKAAEVRFTELNQQDEFKRTIFAAAMKFIETGSISPLAVGLLLGDLFAVLLAVDNIKKRTHINTLKGGNANDKTPTKTNQEN
jgi:hypothetical protein